MQVAPVAGQASPLGECAQSLVSQYHESFGPGDANAQAVLFKDNAIWFNAFGAQGLGREGVREIWEQLLSSGTFNTAQRQVLGTSMHELSGGSMIVDQVQRISGQRTPGEPGRELPDRFVHLTFIVEKAAEGCLFAYRAGDLRALPQWTPPVAVRIETLREYVGRYVSELRGDTVEVRLENEKLRLVILEDGDVLEMEPVSESEFRVHNSLDTFEFVRDQRGTVAYLLIRGASLDRLTRISQ